MSECILEAIRNEAVIKRDEQLITEMRRGGGVEEEITYILLHSMMMLLYLFLHEGYQDERWGP